MKQSEVRRLLRLGIMTAAAWFGCASQASAQAVMPGRALRAEAANAMVMGALARCQQDGCRVSAAVVDRGGNLLAFIRDPAAGPHTAESSRRKAFTAATFGMTSAAFTALTANPAAALKDPTGVFALAGGVPIKLGTDVLGGVGVGGVPGGEKDEACANAGLAKVADQLK
jgi:uncharacterized protein GlcG (DUF336 family)